MNAFSLHYASVCSGIESAHIAPRITAIGNAWPVLVARWIEERLKAAMQVA